MEQTENTYSKVIFKQDHDQHAQKLVNSYRFKESSPSRYKIWKPEIQSEELARRKRHREDKYIQNFSNQERPILVIQNKEEYQNKTISFVQHSEEGDNYLKLSQNTQEIEDPQKEILGQTNLIRRETTVHGSQSQNDQNAHLYKIEGIEFLPQGFLELDPLLFHDEFAFENDNHKEIFNKEQRRLKAIRRKQYEMRNQHKMRNVTLFIEDEKTEKVIQFLEKWYFQKRRKMNDAELEVAARELDVDLQAMRELQENYLNYKKIQNTKDLKNYLGAKGKINGNNINIPENFRKYFVKNDPNVSNIQLNESKGSFEDSLRQNQNGNFSKSNVKLSEVDFEPENSRQFQKIRSSLKKDESVQGYLDNEINKILQQIQGTNNQSKFEDYQKMLNKKKSPNKSQGQNNNVDQEAIDQIIAQLINSKKSGEKMEKTSQSLYQDIMKQKNLQTSKFTKPKTVAVHSKPVQKSQSKTKSSKQTQPDKARQTINLKFQTTDGQYYLIQKLEPLQIGNNFYFLSIEEHIPLSGAPSVNLITRDEQGVVISNKPIEMDQMSKFYQTKVFLEPQNLTTDNKFVFVVENEKGNVLSTQKIREKLPSFIDERVYSKQRGSVGNPMGYFKDDKSIHILQPVNIGGHFYQQVVKELINENGLKQLQIITHDEKGVVLATDLVHGNFGDQFSTVVAEDFINQEKRREFTLLTMDNKSNEVARHFGTQSSVDNEYANIVNDILKGRVSVLRQNGKTIQLYSLPITFAGNNFFKQKLYETVDDRGQRQRQLVTFNENGDIVGRDTIDPELLGKHYYSKIAKEYKQDGMPYILLVTKNDREEVVNMKEICVFNDKQGKKMINDFAKICQNNTSYTQTAQKKSMVGGKNILIKPVIYKHIVLQQSIQETGVGQQPKTKITTVDSMQNTLSSHIIPQSDYKGSSFQTKVAQIDGTQTISVTTLNENGEIVFQQELEDSYDEILTEKYIEEFEKKADGKFVIVSKRNFTTHKFFSYLMRPCNIQDNTFQQAVIEIEDEFKDKERILFTRDLHGEILAADSINAHIPLDECMVQKFVESQEQANTAIICLFNKSDEELGKQIVSFIPLSNYKKRQVQKFDSTIRHQISLDQCGINHHQLEVEELLEGEEIKLRVKCLKNGKEIENLEADNSLLGEAYHAKVMGSFINQEGKRKTIVQVLNDKNQVLVSLELENQADKERFEHYTFDGKTMEELKRNSVQTQKPKKGQQTTLKRLRPTQVGRRTYDCVFEEVVGNDGSKRLTLIMKDENENEIVKNEVDKDFMADNYECYLDSRLNELDSGTNLVFRNSKNRLLNLNNLIKNEHKDSLFKGNFDNIKEVFDDHGRKQSTIFTQKTPRQTLVNHRLKPTLIGSQHYQITINEVLEGDQKVSATLLIQDQQGRLVASKELPLETEVEKYYSEILEDVVANNKQQRVTLILKNQNDEEVTQVILSPEALCHYNDLKTNLIEEVLDKEGKKKISVFYKDRLNHVLQTIKEEKEPENSALSSHQDKVKHFENLQQLYGGKVKPNRFSVNPLSQTMRSKALTLNLLQKQDFSQLQSVGRNKQNSFNQGMEDILKDLDERKSTINGPRKSSVSPQALEQLKKLRKSTMGQINEDELKRQVSNLMNEEKEKLIHELMNELIQDQGSIPEDEIEAFLRFCREELIYDQSYKDQILMVSLFYYFLKKKQGWKLN